MTKHALFILLTSAAFSATAQTADATVLSTVTASIGAAAANILPQAITWLGSFMAIQLVMTNFALLKSGADIEAVFGKVIGSLAWFSVCIYFLNHGPNLIDAVGTGVFDKFAPNIPTTGSIITATLTLSATLLIAIGVVGTSIVGVGNSSLAMVLVYVLFTIFSIGMYMAVKIFMLQLELALIVMLSPLSFSFLGLNALKDQGIAPFKSLLSLVYRIILLGIIFSAFGEVIAVTGVALDGMNWSNPLMYGSALNTIFAMLASFPILAYLVFKSDSIAASLAGGSSNMGAGDVAGAAAAGAAAGAAIASGSGVAGGVASKPVQTMANFMKGLGGGGSVSNASSTGMGGASGALPLPATAMASQTSGGGSGAMSNAAAPAFETNKAGGPMNPDPTANIAGPPNIAKSNTPSPSSVSGPNAGGGSESPGDASSAPVAGAGMPNTSQPSPLPSPSSGSGATAGVSGSASTTDQKFDKLIDQMAAQQSGGKRTFADRLGNANQHIAQEKAATHVSISMMNAE